MRPFDPPSLRNHFFTGMLLSLVALGVCREFTHSFGLLSGLVLIIGFFAPVAIWLIRMRQWSEDLVKQRQFYNANKKIERIKHEVTLLGSQRPFTRSEAKQLARQRARIRARRKAQTSLAAQLRKPTYDSRLNQFLTNVQTNESDHSPCENKTTRTKFWQLRSNYKKTKPKSTSYIRLLLARIAATVGRSRKRI